MMPNMIYIQIKNIKILLQYIESQYQNNIIIPDLNSAYNGIELLNLGIQMLKMGIENPNINEKSNLILQIQNFCNNLQNQNNGFMTPVNMMLNPMGMPFQNMNFNINNNQKLEKKLNVLFKNTAGEKINITPKYGTPINKVIEEYLAEIGLDSEDKKKFDFIYKAHRINVNDQKKVEDYFEKGVNWVLVHPKDNLIGGLQ